jgi:hypothetical protein
MMNNNEEIIMEEEVVENAVEDETSETEEKSLPSITDVASYATSFGELEAEQVNRDNTLALSDLSYNFSMLSRNIIEASWLTPEEKSTSLANLTAEYQERAGTYISQMKEKKSVISTIVDRVKSLIRPEQPQKEEKHTRIMLWKEEGEPYRWIANYSNNFRDDDTIPEIIADASHRAFVNRVDNGDADNPELWVWHRPEWHIGKAEWVAYDESGFAIAGGYIYPEFEDLAKELESLEDIAVSHGMPPSSIRRDKNDPTIIVAHETKEISILPRWAAANKLTGFVLLEKEEAEMAIPKSKRDVLVNQWGISPDLLERLEKANESAAEKAKRTKPHLSKKWFPKK